MAMDTPFGSLDGAPIFTQFAITQTEKLAEFIDEFDKANKPVPGYLTAGIGELASHLQRFRPDDGIQLFLAPGMDPEEIVYNNLEVAWWLSACLYFYNRLTDTFDDNVPFSVNTILMCLLRAEEIKTMIEPDVSRRRNPVTFPAFVAACNASFRQSWVYWWRSVQKYYHLTAGSQWLTIKLVWAIKQSMAAGVNLSWVDILRGTDEDKPALSVQYELLGFYR
ncbi:hypothetical protein N7536_009399 [Penicillium majusculum]|uniref:Uncharacterized protein n=1 Tax=Penicillium solitum TaxID=60172 RepID=A0A1V6RA56_9EURO|nr:uncharacterized protein PENSOL_c010G00706 [Penicillium solitum]KAJ5686780.1 hypothetical protein N7536_009399 [Penicillium majusculum]OQD98163.1 hypothetical protein PENSOL_c010G00706 [Penicillium solitum]